MSGKIEISRELLELAFEINGLAAAAARHEIRQMLAAPVVERQPAGYVHQWELDRISKGQAHWATFWNSNGANNPSRGGDPVALYTSPPAPVAADIAHDRAYRNGLMAGFSFGIRGDEDGYAKAVERYDAEIHAAKSEQPAPGEHE